MNLKKLLMIMGGIYSPVVIADIPLLDPVNFRIVAEIVDRGCLVEPSSTTINVDLRQWVINSELKKTGDQTVPVPFSISLRECNASNIKFRFSGEKNLIDSRYLALNVSSDAKNVAIAILDWDKRVIPFGEYSEVWMREPNPTQSFKINFYAAYVSTSGVPTAGKANGVATFEMYYD